MNSMDEIGEMFFNDLLSKALKFKKECDEMDLEEAERTFRFGKLLGFTFFVTLKRYPLTPEQKAEIDLAATAFYERAMKKQGLK